MQIRFKQNHVITVDGIMRYLSKGDIRDYIPDTMAQQLIQSGIAQAVEQPKKTQEAKPAKEMKKPKATYKNKKGSSKESVGTWRFW